VGFLDNRAVAVEGDDLPAALEWTIELAVARSERR